MATATGTLFELEIDEMGRISRVAGPWPDSDGAEFELHGELPNHIPLEDAPAHIHAFASVRGRHVCMYDPDSCQTCFCDDAGDILYCRKMC
jgi:hypothetical protein